MEDTVRGATRFWRLLPLLYLAHAAFLLFFLSFPANIVPAVVFLVLGLGQWGMGKFLGQLPPWRTQALQHQKAT